MAEKYVRMIPMKVFQGTTPIKNIVVPAGTTAYKAQQDLIYKEGYPRNITVKIA